MSSPKQLYSWLSERQAVAHMLQERAQSTGSAQDARTWEGYVRRTAQMQAVSGRLETAFRTAGSPYRLRHGVTIMTAGRTAYLEHIVAGPGGIFLIEHLDQEDPAWVRDLAQNIAFFRQAAPASFACLVIQREPLRIHLPEGANVVDSVDIAIDVIRQDAELETPAMVDEIWHMLDALAVMPSAQPKPTSWWQRIGRLGKAILAAAAVPAFIMAVEIPGVPALFSLIMGMILFLLPALGVIWLISRVQRESSRRTLMWVVLIAAILFDLLLLLGASMDTTTA